MSPRPVELCLVLGDDWVGLYSCGTLVMEGHSLPLLSVLEELVGKAVTKVTAFQVRQEWLENRGCFPEKLEAVEKP
jgi:hypothetical protein